MSAHRHIAHPKLLASVGCDVRAAHLVALAANLFYRGNQMLDPIDRLRQLCEFWNEVALRQADTPGLNSKLDVMSRVVVTAEKVDFFHSSGVISTVDVSGGEVFKDSEVEKLRIGLLLHHLGMGMTGLAVIANRIVAEGQVNEKYERLAEAIRLHLLDMQAKPEVDVTLVNKTQDILIELETFRESGEIEFGRHNRPHTRCA